MPPPHGTVGSSAMCDCGISWPYSIAYRLFNFFALVVEYIGTGAPECIFHNQLKTLYNLYSPGPCQSVFCFADKQVSHRDIAFCCISFRRL